MFDNNKECIAKGFIKNDEIYFYFNLPNFAKISIHNQLGKDLIDFIWIDSRPTENLFNAIYDKYLFCLKHQWSPENIMDYLIEFLRPVVNKNTYLTAYFAVAIEFLLTEPTKKNTALTFIAKRLGNDAVDVLEEYYSQKGLKTKEAFVKKIPLLIKQQQSRLEADLELLVDEKLIEYTPAQRLFILERSNSLKMNYKNTRFESSIDCVDDVRDMNEEEVHHYIKSQNTEFVEMYVLPEIEDMLRFELTQMILHQRMFKRCKYCKQLFIPSGRSDSEYCERVAPHEKKPCNVVGAYRTRDTDVKNNKIKSEYKKAYNRMYSRKRNGIIGGEFNVWSWQALELRDKCLDGEITFEEYKAWLDETKERVRRDRDEFKE